MGGDLIAFSDLCDRIGTYAEDLCDIYGCKLPVKLFNESESLYDVTSKGSWTLEKRMMMNIAATREIFREKLSRILLLLVARTTWPTV